MQQNQVFSQNW